MNFILDHKNKRVFVLTFGYWWLAEHVGSWLCRRREFTAQELIDGLEPHLKERPEIKEMAAKIWAFCALSGFEHTITNNDANSDRPREWPIVASISPNKLSPDPLAARTAELIAKAYT